MITHEERDSMKDIEKFDLEASKRVAFLDDAMNQKMIMSHRFIFRRLFVPF